MSEFFHQASGEWNQPQNQSNYAEVANEPAKEQVKKVHNVNMFGAGATAPSGGQGQLQRPEEPMQHAQRPKVSTEQAPLSKAAEQQGKPALSKKTNPFV